MSVSFLLLGQYCRLTDEVIETEQSATELWRMVSILLLCELILLLPTFVALHDH